MFYFLKRWLLMGEITDKKTLEQSIKEQCLEHEGILDLLRSKSFDILKYIKFHETVEQYYETIKGTPNINRKTAGYLQVFQMLLLGALQYHEEFGVRSKIREQLQNAFNQFSELMDKI